MESFVTSADGKVPRKMGERYGRELTFRERVSNNIYGIGFFKPSEQYSNIFTEWYKLKNNTIRPHIDQLTQGLIFRLKDTRQISTLAIEYSEIKSICINTIPDEVTPIPLSPFWTLIKLGFRPRKVRWLALSWGLEFRFGAVEVQIEIIEQEPIILIWSARHESSVRAFFGSKYLKAKQE